MQRMFLKSKACSSVSQQRVYSLKVISINAHSYSCDNIPAIRLKQMPAQAHQQCQLSSPQAGRLVWAVRKRLWKAAVETCSQTTCSKSRPHNLAEEEGTDWDSERQDGSRVALRLRKESRPTVVSNKYLLKDPGPERRVKGQVFTKTHLKVVPWYGLEDMGASGTLLCNWTPSFLLFFF